MEAIAQDFQGWPIYKKTFKELLLELGAVEKDGFIGFSSDTKFLDEYPTTLTDDGMGYGVEEMVFTDAEIVDETVRFWRDIPDPDYKNTEEA